MRYWSLLLMLNSAFASVGPKAENDGRGLYSSGKFRQAAHAFELAIAVKPGCAELHYWLGRSYARLADESNLLLSPLYTRRARRSLELAARIDTQNEEYLMALVYFYIDHPQLSLRSLKSAQDRLWQVRESPAIPMGKQSGRSIIRVSPAGSSHLPSSTAESGSRW